MRVKTGALFLGAMLLASRLALAENAASEPVIRCPLKQLAEVDLEVTENRVLLPVSLNGRQVMFALGTNVLFSVIHRSAVEELGLRRDELRQGVFRSRRNFKEYTTVRSLGLGRLDLGKAQLLIDPRDTIKFTFSRGPVIGALGTDVLSAADFELDLAHGKLRLFSPDHCPGKVVYWADEYSSAPIHEDFVGGFFVPMELNGQRIETSLASGVRFTRLHVGVSKRLFGVDESSPEVTVETNQDGRTRTYFRPMQLSMQGLTIPNARVQLLPYFGKCELRVGGGKADATGYDCAGITPLALGVDVLRQLRLYFATKEKLVYFTKADATREQNP